MYSIKSGSSEFDDNEYPTLQGNKTEKPYMQYSYAPFILNCLSNCLNWHYYYIVAPSQCVLAINIFSMSNLYNSWLERYKGIKSKMIFHTIMPAVQVFLLL